MTESPNTLEELLRKLSGDVSEILGQQKGLGERMETLEERIAAFETKKPAGGGGDPAPVGVLYDYRILEHVRQYNIKDTGGHEAEMSSVRRCLALRDLPEIRTRYHTGTGNRKVQYSYRVVPEGPAGESEWVPVEFRTNKGAGADFSAILSLPQPILIGESFELRHEIEMVDSFSSHNEWVSMVVEYPTEKLNLGVFLPSSRTIQGARREISEGASQSFDKRRLVPQKVPGEDRIAMRWEEINPITGRTYTIYWDW